jgi:glycine/D-amino acid oxidase-like deaminating enzyme
VNETGDVLSGRLTHFAPAEVLQLLRLAQASGVLDLESSGERVSLLCERGRPVFARTDGLGVRAGQVLVHRGVVSVAQLDTALALQRLDPTRRIGALLVERGAASSQQVEDAVREVVKRIIYRVLLWRDGTFRFHPDRTIVGEDIQLDLDLDRMILEGLRLADEARGSA